MEVVDGVYTRWFGNEDECAWLGLNQATDEALPEYDHQGQTDIIDGDKGGRKANECRKFKIFADYLRKLDNCRVNEDVLSFKKAAHQQMMKLWSDGSTKEILPTLRPTPMV